MSGQRPSPGGFMRNWRAYDAGAGRKAWLALRNLARRPLRMADCCGHPGEPGC